MSGMVGLLFREFAVTVAVAIVVSVIVSLTLTPMMCARLLTAASDGRARACSRARWSASSTGWSPFTTRALVVALRHRFITLMVMIATVAATVVLFVRSRKAFSRSRTRA